MSPLDAASTDPSPTVDLGALIDELHIGVWAIDRDAVTTYANPRMGEIIGSSPDEMVGRSVLDYFLAEDHPVVVDRIRRRSRGERDEYEARLRRADGSVAHVRVHGSPVTSTGTLIGSIAAITDISDLHSAAEQREAALHDAEITRQARTRLMAWVAHELRTPLSTISGFAQLLAGSGLGSGEREMVDHIITAASHVDSLVHDLLDFSKADATLVATAVEPTSLAAVVNEATVLVAGPAADRGVEFHLDVGDEWALADLRKLVVVLVNLLSNAVKYGGDGNPVSVSVRRKDGLVRCSVTDRGPGIQLQSQRHIFLPFERLTNTRGASGVGLGLAIADALTRAMGGTLSLASAVGEGTTFTVELPAASRPAPHAPPGLPPSRAQATILCIEDEPLNAALIESIVSLLPGRTVQLVPNVVSAIEALSRMSPSLVLLDLNLPDGSGLDVLDHIRADDRLHTTPVFVLSADATDAASRRADEHGADRFITKPFDLDHFLRWIEEVTT